MAKANGVHPSTLSIGKSEAWWRAVDARWREQYDGEFGEVVRALCLRATDVSHPQGVQAARLRAELLDKFPDKTKKPVDLFSWLAVLPPEQVTEAVRDGR